MTIQDKEGVWRKCYDRHGNPYYVNHITAQSTWYPPEVYSADRDPTLPNGWVIHTINGDAHYMNTVGQYTSWYHPVTGAEAPTAPNQ